jgi:cellulose synthase/poly-beta-1,6-N-acetylglucosamine synthase-like glycosyltransferase
MNILLWILLALIIYTYFGYFALVILLGPFLGRKVKKADIEPHVTMLIAAYNEEKGIAKKIQETLDLDYPKAKLRIIVVSDGSTDNTDKIVLGLADQGVELLRVEGRVGKTEARNVAMDSLEGEIVLFSDATTEYQPDAIRKLVRNFADPMVGMVTGHLRYRSPGKSKMGAGQILYWRYESMIKHSQTAMGTLTGSVGCMSAFRRELYTRLPDNIIEDFTGPLMLVIKGFRVVYEEEAICTEETTTTAKSEWKMRVRVIRGGMTGMIFAKQILNPIKYPVASFQLVSHKILRWLIPVFMILVLLLNTLVVLNDHADVYTTLLALQVIFYATALFSLLLSQVGIHVPLSSIPLYFIVVNAASMVALGKTLSKNLEATWEPQREGA